MRANFDTGMKICFECGAEKSIHEFYKNRSTIDGLKATCKACAAAYEKTPTYKSCKSAYDKTPKQKSKRAIYEKTPRCRAYRSAYSKTPERRDHSVKCVMGRRIRDPFYKFQSNIRIMLCGAFKRRGYTKRSKAFQILGCKFDKLLEYTGWKPGLEIHHIKPLCLAKTEEDVVRLNHYTNLVALKPQVHDLWHKLHDSVLGRRMVKDSVSPREV